MKHISYKFIDGSEIDIHDDQTATITGSTTKFAYSLWRIATKDNSMKRLWTAIFIGIVDKLNEKNGIVTEKIDHFLNEQKKYYDQLIQSF